MVILKADQTVKYLMESPNPFVTIANILVRDKNYTVHVSICTTTARIHIFKYSESRLECSYEVFDNHLEAALWLDQLL